MAVTACWNEDTTVENLKRSCVKRKYLDVGRMR